MGKSAIPRIKINIAPAFKAPTKPKIYVITVENEINETGKNAVFQSVNLLYDMKYPDNAKTDAKSIRIFIIQ